MFYALNSSNNYTVLKNEYELYSYLRNIELCQIGHNLNDSYIEQRFGYTLRVRCKVKCVIFDENLKVVSLDYIEKIKNDISLRFNPNRKRYSYNRIYDKQYPGFRNGPVPGIHKYSAGSYFRSPRTTQEKRFFCDLTNRPYIRARRARSIANLVDSWDDIHRSDMMIKRSWKKQKKRKQWM